jgi:putative thioredoxin
LYKDFALNAGTATDSCDFAGEDAFWRRDIWTVLPIRPGEGTKGKPEHGGDFWPHAGGAAELYAAIMAENPGDPAAVAGLAKLLIAAGELESARTVLASIAANGERDNAIIAARAALDLAGQAAVVGDASELMRKIAAKPADHQARFDFAILLNAQNRREEAAAELIEIINRDRAWNDDGARKQLLQFFDAWGAVDPATIRARRKLSALLFS